MNQICAICGRKAYSNPVEGFLVNDCHECERPTCQDCAEVDYDMVGDPPYYKNTQWDCSICVKEGK